MKTEDSFASSINSSVKSACVVDKKEDNIYTDKT